jgi:GT2 family glycosyltransferase
MEAVTFAAALVRRDVFYQVRGFDEEYDCYWEDADFCMKARASGWSVWYTPHANGIHDESQSTSELKNRMLEHGSRIFSRKWSSYFKKHPV